jgi:hypothetical protein
VNTDRSSITIDEVTKDSPIDNLSTAKFQRSMSIPNTIKAFDSSEAKRQLRIDESMNQNIDNNNKQEEDEDEEEEEEEDDENIFEKIQNLEYFTNQLSRISDEVNGVDISQTSSNTNENESFISAMSDQQRNETKEEEEEEDEEFVKFDLGPKNMTDNEKTIYNQKKQQRNSNRCQIDSNKEIKDKTNLSDDLAEAVNDIESTINQNPNDSLNGCRNDDDPYWDNFEQTAMGNINLDN